jgi:hypothetical protein
MIMRTFQEVFPSTYLWRAPQGAVSGYYLTGLKDRTTLDLTRAIQAPDDPAVVADLNEWYPPVQP